MACRGSGEPRPAKKLGKSADLWAVSYDQVPEGQTVQASLDGKQWKTVGQYKASEGKPLNAPAAYEQRYNCPLMTGRKCSDPSGAKRT